MTHNNSDTKIPLAPSERKSRNLYIIAMAFGFALGLLLVFGSPNGIDAFFTNGPLEPMVAAIAIIAWVVFVPLITFLWWRATDEHELAAYNIGGSAGLHAYFVLAPGWWAGSRAGWLPNQDPMIVLLIVSAIWMVVWLFKRRS